MDVNTNNIEATFDLQQQNFDALFSINAAGTTWGNIDGNIENQADLIAILNSKATNEALTALATTVTNNYTTLDTKIDSVQSNLSGNISVLNTKVEGYNTALSNRIDTLSDTVSDNYTTLDGKITTINNTLSGYGNIVTHNVAEFATAAQGLLADTALQPNDNISELNNNVGYITGISSADVINALGYTPYNATNPNGYISGIDSTDVVTALGYTPYDSSNPDGYITSASLPTVNNNTITIQKNSANIGSFTLNQSSNDTINIIVPTDTNDLTNGAGFITSASLPTLEDLTTTSQLAAINSGATSVNIGQIATNATDIGNEVTNRQNADIALQSQIDAIVASSDVFDIVGTYAELQAYDITTVPVNDIIKVLVDSTHNNAATYYRCVENNNVKSWSYIGSEGAYYTKGEADSKFVEKTITINGQPLSSNVTLTASDVNALPSSTTIGTGVLTVQKNGTTIDTFGANDTGNTTINITVPTDTGDLTNNAGFITGITGTDVTNALGYTPYDSSNPSGYTSNIGTVTSVNNVQPVDGNVTLTIPDTATWGNITGTLSNQTDLNNALGDKQDLLTSENAGTDIAITEAHEEETNTSVTGNDSINLVNAKANSLEYLKLFGGTELLPETYLDTVTASGGCEQNGTPTADQPIDIISNNGAIKVSPNLLNMNDLYGYYLLTDGGQVGSTAENFILTNFIRVFPNTTYTFSFISGTNAQYRRVCGYSSADQTTFTQLLIKKARPTAEDTQFDLTFTTDANTNYIRISTCVVDTNAQVVEGSTAPTYRPYKQIYTDGTVETVTDNVGNVATCQMLLKIFNSIDTQEILSGTVTRDIDITVLDGSEGYTKLSTKSVFSSSLICPNITRTKSTMYCTHFVYDSGSTSEIPDGTIGTANTSTNVFIRNDSCTSVVAFQQWLKDQYAAGTPVIIVYQRQTETTETVTGQVLTKSPVTQTAGAISGLTITTTESSHTVPTPTNPLQINCNNGVVKVSKNVFDYEYYYDNYQIYTGSQVGRCPIKFQPNTQYTVSTNTEASSSSAKIFVTSGSAINWIPATANNGVLSNSPRTVTTDSSGYLCIGIYYTGGNAVLESDFVNGTVWVQIEKGSTATPYRPYGIYADGTQEVVTDNLGNTANAERLLAVDTYKDTQEVISGGVTRNVGILVLNGTETWTYESQYSRFYAELLPLSIIQPSTRSIPAYCSHFVMLSNGEPFENITAGQGYVARSNQMNSRVYLHSDITTLEGFKQFLADQYNAGQPVIIIYPLATPTTETVTTQPMNVQVGNNTISITQSSISNLPLEAEYIKVENVATKISFTNDSGFITDITSSDVTTALGYTPYNASNPNNYTSNVGTVISVNNTQPDNNGNVTLSIPSISNLADKDLSNLSATGEAKFQEPLVSGTNIKTINSTSLLGSGNIVALQNTATGTNALTLLGNASAASGAINIGSGSNGTGQNAVAIGEYASASKLEAIAIGYGASATQNNSIQLGGGTNTISNTLSVGFDNNLNYQLLDGTTGLIPNARLNTATTSTKGIVQPDGTTITINDGVISSVGGGLQNTATGTNSLTILGTACTDSYSLNIGDSSNAIRSNSVAIGNSANTVAQYSVAIGYNAKAGTSSDSSNGAVAIGYNAGGDYSKGNTVAIGNNAVAKSTGSIAIGDSAEVGNTNYTNGIAIGEGSQVYGANSINLGYGANVTANSFSVGFYGQNSNEPYTLLDGTTGLIPEARIGTFASSINSTAINPIVNKLTNADITVAPSNDIDSGIRYVDNNNNGLGGFANTRYTSGLQGTSMYAENKISGTNKLAYFGTYVDSNGNDFADGSDGVKSTITNWAMPKTNARTQLFTPSNNMNGVPFVASQTKNGYLYFASTTSQNAHVVYLHNNSAGMETSSSAVGAYVIEAFIPVAKGQTCEFYYYDNNGGGGYTTYFIEASGG